jgi:hypothetical protein
VRASPASKTAPAALTTPQGKPLLTSRSKSWRLGSKPTMDVIVWPSTCRPTASAFPLTPFAISSDDEDLLRNVSLANPYIPPSGLGIKINLSPLCKPTLKTSVISAP